MPTPPQIPAMSTPTKQEALQEFIEAGITTTARVGEITESEYFHSALRHKMIRCMVREVVVSFEDALQLPYEDVGQSALANYHIASMVINGHLSFAHARDLPLQEINDPIRTLFALQNSGQELTESQNWRLRLYTQHQGMTPPIVERLIYLRSMAPLSHIEHLEVQLLLSPITRPYAQQIIELTRNAEQARLSHYEERLLHYYSYLPAVPYARDIVRLEELPPELLDDGIIEILQDYYLKICCKIYPEDLVPQTRLSIFDPLRRARDDEEIDHSINANGQYTKRHIQTKLRRDLVHPYIVARGATTSVLETETMQAYVSEKVNKLTFRVLQYFADPETADYNDANLNELLSKVNGKFNARQWTLDSLGNFLERFAADERNEDDARRLPSPAPVPPALSMRP